MNNQQRVLALLSVFIMLSGAAISIFAAPLDADEGAKVGSGSCDGCIVTYIDSGTPGYGIMTVTLDETPSENYITVRIDGVDSAPMVLEDRTVTFACYELSVGSHQVIVDGLGYRAVITLSVGYEEESQKVTGIVLNRTSEILLIGERFQLDATVQATEDIVTVVGWSSSDESVVMVSSTGLITALSEGEATITAECGGISAVCKVSVKMGTSQSIETEDISDDGVKTTVSGVEKTFDDGSVRIDVVETVESETEVKTVNKVVDTDTDGRSVASEKGTIELKDSGIVMAVERTSESVQGVENTSETKVSVVDDDVTTVASEKKEVGGMVTKSMVTVIESTASVVNGSSTVTVDDAVLEKAIGQIEAVSGQVTDVRPVVELSSGTDAEVSGVTVSMSVDGLKALVDGTGSDISIVTPVATVAFDNVALKELGGVDGNVTKFVTKKVASSELSDEHASLVGDNPVFDLSVFVDSEKVSDFGNGNVGVAIPYDLKAGESASDLKVWCISGSEPEMFECTFEDGLVSFTTPHLSVWTVGTSITEPSEDDSGSVLILTLVLLLIAALGVGAIVYLARRP